jgi:hypothetical protein
MSALVQVADSVCVASDTVNTGHDHGLSCPDALISCSASLADLRLSESDELTLYSAPDSEALLLKLPPSPVPKLQLGALCLARLADPITFTQVSSVHQWCTAHAHLSRLGLLDLSIYQ